MSYPDKNIDREKFVSDAEKYYEQIKSNYEPDFIGKFLAIDPEAEKIYLADSSLEVLKKAKEAQPDSFFFIKKIGFDTVATFANLNPNTYQGGVKNG